MAQQKIQLRKIRDFGENLGDTFQFIRQEFKPLASAFILISGIFILSSSILGGLYQKQAFGFLDDLKTGTVAPQNTFSNIFTAGYFIFILVTVLNISAMRTVIAVYMKLYDELDEPPTLQQVWSLFAKNFFKIFAYSIPQFILIVIGCLFCLAPGIYFMVVLMPYPFVIVNENQSFGDAFSRCINITKENFWISLGTYFIAYLIYSISSGIIGVIVAGVVGVGSYFSTNEISSTAAIATSVLSVVQYVFYIVFFVSVGLQYYNLAELKDGTGLERRLANLGGSANSNAGIEEQY
ncbi:MAG TPA: hypothetical protein PLA68_10960 [Panacibacter sp.]|nr:hypothetical protein [Panacibacter sp.]